MWRNQSAAYVKRWRWVSAPDRRWFSCLLLWEAEGPWEGWWATSAPPEADSDLAGGIPGEGVAQRRLVEAPPVSAEVIVVVHVVQHFTGQLLLPAETTQS